MDQVQPLHVPAGLPIDQATREEHVALGAANLLNENVRFTSRGCLAKRNGFTALSTLRLDGTSRTSGYKLFSYGEQMCIVDGHVLDVFDPITGTNVTRDRVPECGAVDRVPMPYTSGTPLLADSSVTSNGFLIAGVVQIASPNISFLVNVLNAETNELVRSDVLLSNVAGTGWAGVTMVGTTAIALYVVAGAVNTIKARTLDCSSAAGITAGWTAAVTLCTDRFDGLAFDTTPMGDRFALIYVNTAGGSNQVSVKTLDHTATLIAATTLSTGAVGTTVSVAGNVGDTLWCSYVTATAHHNVIGLDPIALGIVSTQATALIGGTSTAFEALTATSLGAGEIVIEQGSTGNVLMWTITFSNVAGTTTIGITAEYVNLKPVTKPWYVDGRVYVGVSPQDVAAGGNTQKCFFVVDITTASTTLRPVASIAPRLSILSSALAQHVSLVSGKRFVFLNLVVRNQLSLNTTSGSFGPSFEATYVDFGDPRRWLSQEYNGNLYLGGAGVTTYFDGMLVRESGFMKRPDQPTTTTSGTGYTDTNVRYVAVYESIDSSGNVEWSAVSDPSTQISPSNVTVNVKVSTMTVTSRYDTDAPANIIQIAIYRTTAGGTVFFRVGVIANDVTQTTVTFADNVATAVVTANAQLYKAPGVPGTAQEDRKSVV